MTSEVSTEVGAQSALAPVLDALAAHVDVDAWLAAFRALPIGGSATQPRSADARSGDALVGPLIAAAHHGGFEGLDAYRDADSGVVRRMSLHRFERRGAEPIVAVVPTDADAERLAETISWYLPDGMSAAYIARGVLYGGGIAAAAPRVGAREFARSVHARGGVVVASIEALIERVPPPRLRPAAIRIAAGDTIDRDALVERLVAAGYERAEQAEERGQIAVRGDIVDVYGVTARHPARIAFWDDEVEAIRNFSSYTQRSLGQIRVLDILPAVEVGADDTLDAWYAGHDDGDPILELAGTDMRAALDDFAGARLVVWDAANVQRELDERLQEIAIGHAAGEGYLDDDQATALVAAAVRIDAFDHDQPFAFDAQPPVFGAVGLREAENELAGLVSRGLHVVVTFPHQGQATRTADQLRKVDARDLAPSDEFGDEPSAHFAVSLAAAGFVSRQLGLAVVPSGRLFRQKIERDQPGSASSALAAFTHLKAGDYIVHEDHGVGRFAGFETKTVAGVTRDYLYLEFAGEDRLYVPHEQIGKVTRYVGSDGSAPALSQLGGKRWANLKNRARHAVRELAGELLALYAKRARAVGTAAPADDELMARFELGFPFTETDDQAKAIAAVKEDMERPQPMDRLICGDVGFGKTEVAMRAAAKCAEGGRQTMVLVPTTVLAQQHLVSFRERFGELPVEIDMVSRFRTPKQTKDALARFAAGKLDVLIGTHRLLSKDVLPADLGLVVVDEEQRFGVQQKELLRQLRLEVDTLALSATPIPRTLHMSLTGMRDISVIETAPRGRRPIHTHVGEYDEQLVKLAIERELERDGQVFFLHNRVDTIDETAEKIRQIVPTAHVGVGHGQMTEKQLESVMLGFLRGDFDVLVATTIIESGLDIPTANTLIVDRADRLGLSQLYQIRGRVGRSDRSAHAYLFYPSARELSEEARARLTTLSDFTDLGSGSRIAMRDLELRGAGNLLGAEQSGHVAAIGFELYVEMLAEAVAEMSGHTEPLAKNVAIDVKIDAYVPADYIASEAIKIDVHRRIALARSEAQLDALEQELTDRFGELPQAMTHLVTLGRLRIRLEQLGADRLTVGGGKVALAKIEFDREAAAGFRTHEPLAAYAASRGEIQVRIPDGVNPLERAERLIEHVAAALE